MRIAAALAFLALGLSVSGAASAKPAPARDWSTTVAATPEGGFRMGNPGAKVKLVEYGSLACPHCRHFEETGYKPLVAHYVRAGKVSYEFRNLLLNAADISISLLAHCAGPAKFFPMSHEVFATQPQWEDKVIKLSEEQKAEIEKMTDKQKIVRMADVAGFRPIAARYGVATTQANQCLADPKGIERLLTMTQKAEDSGINHTPTFIINGTVNNATVWEDLEPLLKKAGA
jgi:protein-disulfide isomerase